MISGECPLSDPSHPQQNKREGNGSYPGPNTHIYTHTHPVPHTHVVPRRLNRKAEKEPAKGPRYIPLLLLLLLYIILTRGVEQLCRRVRGREDAPRRDRLKPATDGVIQ